MEKKKLSFIIMIFLAIIVFSMSATCNFCGIDIKTEDTGLTSQKNLESDEQASEDMQIQQENFSSREQDQQGGNDDQQDPEQQNDAEANDEGVQPDNQNQADEDINSDENLQLVDEIESINITKPIYIWQQGTGYLIDGDPKFYYMESFTVGEKDGKLCQGFITMDVSELIGMKLKEATFRFRALPQGNPSIFEQIHLALYFWGDRPPGPADFNASSDIIASYPPTISDEQTVTNQIFLNKLQGTIDMGINKFQLKVFVSGAPNGDGVDDYFYFDTQSFRIDAVYEFLESG